MSSTLNYTILYIAIYSSIVIVAAEGYSSLSLASVLIQRPPLGQASWLSGSRVRGVRVLVPGLKLSLRSTLTIPTLASSSANLMPIQARGPWPNAWKAYLDTITSSRSWIVLNSMYLTGF